MPPAGFLFSIAKADERLTSVTDTLQQQKDYRGYIADGSVTGHRRIPSIIYGAFVYKDQGNIRGKSESEWRYCHKKDLSGHEQRFFIKG